MAAQPKSRRRRGASSFAGPRGGQALAAATGSGRSQTAVVGSCDARNDVTCSQNGDSTDGRAHSYSYSSGYSYGYSYSSGEWAAGVYYYHTESWQGSACSSACYAVASSSRHRRRTSPAAIDGRLRGEKRWGGVKEAVARRLHMFTCQTGTDGTGGGLQSMARVRGLPGSTCRHRNRTPDLQMPDTHTVVVVLKVPIISTLRNNHPCMSLASVTSRPHHYRLVRC